MVSAAGLGASLLPAEEGLGFSFNAARGICRVDVELANSVSVAEWQEIFASRLFQDWLRVYARADRMRLSKVVIQQAQQQQPNAKPAADGVVDGCSQAAANYLSLSLEVEAADSNSGEVTRQPVLLQPLRRAVLLLLRNVETHIDSCIFVRQMNAAVGAAAALSLPEGDFDAGTGRFVGAAATALEKLLGRSVHERECVNMTRMAFGGGGIGLRWTSGASNAAAAAARGKSSGCDKAGEAGRKAATAADVLAPYSFEERVEIYLYRCNLESREMAELETKIGGPHSSKARADTANSAATHPPNGLAAEPVDDTNNDADTSAKLRFSLVQLGRAWSLAADAVAVSALFFVHELRYHGLMPSFRRSAKTSQETSPVKELPKVAATYRSVAELDPNSKGVNLRVRVQQPIVVEKERTLPGGKTRKEGYLVVGDEQAVVTFKVADQQLELPAAVGQPLLIRNASIAMEEGHMKLVVDRWGKVTADIPEEELSQFPSHVNKGVDMSATEYELVVVKEEEYEGRDETGVSASSGNVVGMGGAAGGAGPAAGRGPRRGGGRGRGAGRGRRRGGAAGGAALFHQQK